MGGACNTHNRDENAYNIGLKFCKKKISPSGLHKL
jgi:hypothetical protein